MNEAEFIKQLQNRAKEQKRILNDVPFPRAFAFVTEWLSVHPWRFFIPLALFISLVFRFVFGSSYTDFILLIFRKL